MKDEYSHFVKCSVAVNHLVMFYENKWYQVDSQKKIVSKVETDTEPMSRDEETTLVDKYKSNLDVAPAQDASPTPDVSPTCQKKCQQITKRIRHL